MPEGGAEEALEGRNDFGATDYYGGCMPPQGHGIHHYHFKVYALDAELDADPGLSKDELLAAVKGHVLDEGELVGTYNDDGRVAHREDDKSPRQDRDDGVPHDR